VVADFQPPYFPPPYSVPQPPTGASSAVVEFPPGAGGAPSAARQFSTTNMYGYTAGVQQQPHPGLLLSSSAVGQTDFSSATATATGGGALCGVAIASPRRAAGGEFQMNYVGTAGTAGGLFQTTSALQDFQNFETFALTPARYHYHVVTFPPTRTDDLFVTSFNKQQRSTK